MSDSKTQKQHLLKTKLGGRELILETGKLAELASGAVTVRYGDTVVLATCVVADEPKEGADFFPMIVDYEERWYASGKISGSRFIKRESRPSDAAVLAGRLVDRSLRPLFPKEYRNDLQIIITVLSADLEHDPDVISIIAASAAVSLTSAPFLEPVGAVRVGLIDNQLLINPTNSQRKKCQLDLVVAGTKDKIVMLEGEAKEISDKSFLKAVQFGFKAIQNSISIQEKLKKIHKKEEKVTGLVKEETGIYADVSKILGGKISKALRESDKLKRESEIAAFEQKIMTELEGEYKQMELKSAFDKIIENEIKKYILEEGIRPDGRKEDEIRPISIEIGILPRPHGSALFTRGQTQVMTSVTLAAPGAEQIIETMEEEATKRYMHHYIFPPFSVGEIRPIRSVSRREIGHGFLAERALAPMIPSKEEFPYTIRVVSEVLSSNGSTSMASVCGSSLALMDAGVPIKKSVAGISVGLIMEDKNPKKYKILTDIQGIEDFAGDMDFKLAGTREGVTALQMDVKLPGVSFEIIEQVYQRARKAVNLILDEMDKVISAPKKEFSIYAPRVSVIKINPEKIRDVIGPGGRVINEIIAKTNVTIDIEDDGTIYVSAENGGDTSRACEWIKNLTREVKVGEIFSGKVTRIVDFGAFVEILPGQEGLVHISQLADYHIKKVTDVVKVGDVIPVMVIEIDDQGRINLSHKAAKGNRPRFDNHIKKFGRGFSGRGK